MLCCLESYASVLALLLSCRDIRGRSTEIASRTTVGVYIIIISNCLYVPAGAAQGQ
jgi:hypothetical protein